MLKKINVSDARLGMFITELCGNWMDHPFWKKEFELDKQKDLDTLQQCGIEEVWIDTEKGLDVERRPYVAKDKNAVPEAAAAERKVERHVPVQEEIQRAEKVNFKAKRTTAFLFKEAHMGNALQTGEAVELVDDITHSVMRNPGALLNFARLKNKDDYTYQHSVAVSALMVALGRQMGIEGDMLRSIGLAGLLHDIGKMMLPDTVLNKPRLTDEQYEVFKTHPRLGWKILKEAHDVDATVLDVCLHHHERVDGTGYPERLSGDDLTLFARMAAVCDTYDKLTSDRFNRKGVSPAEAIRRMTELRGTQLDQTVFHAFVKTVGIYPVGTMVKLKSGRLGIVTDQTSKSLLTPIVKVYFSTKVNEPIFPEFVDLSKMPDPIASVEDPDDWKLDWKAMAGL